MNNPYKRNNSTRCKESDEFVKGYNSAFDEWKYLVLRKLQILRDEKLKIKGTVSYGVLFNEGVEEAASGARCLITELMKDFENTV